MPLAYCREGKKEEVAAAADASSRVFESQPATGTGMIVR
jgi:hypothetical protein